MKAWQFIDTDKPLELTDVPAPIAGPGQVVLQMKAAGLCHSDVGLMTDPGWILLLGKQPITIGHENAGEVIAVGEGVTGFHPGDRVGVCPTVGGPGNAPGYDFDGGFGEQMVVPAETLVPIPDGVSYAQGAAATDAGMTAHAAMVTNGGVKAGMNVGVIGFGGLGQIGARVAVLTGANVYVAEVNENVWDLVRASGVKDVRKGIKDFDDVKFDLIVDYAGFGTTTSDAVDIIKRDGTVVLVGMGKLESNIDTRSLILNQCTLKGSNGGSKDDIAGIYAFMASGDLEPKLTEITFDEIPEGLERLHNGKVEGRLVAIY
ncbi:zinc-binding dehydrogenase [Brevibacterium sp. 50QC2O2]|uniref:zinc-binding dehydrogenase n=1 Tax=Brevibacterium TaxID=1696 RepID=UPI00211BE45A|nr:MULTISPECIES: zinc-binding dehydrogenase [unclassified Brevibacterium]MCQ9369463.1 zinc-binding dehydrogenase [Brevibacterium sp. 91QC2O2]MCQ9386870.1 zinc-binding dehydrogenase [Brevibacterium sp. 68QC2CO]MCQ9389839.1 zinc-binding dehydrogenase [Brevibacterium sp. 50QC2O2]